MAAPVDATRGLTSITSAADPWTITMPGSIAAGNLLVSIARNGSGATFNLPAGWSWIVNNDSSDASDDMTAVICKLAAGGDTLSWDLSTTAKGCACTIRITGAADPASRLPEAVILTGTAANANPSAITPSWGSDDYLIICALGMDHETATFTRPSGYTVDAITANSGTTGATATNCQQVYASKGVTGVTSEDPGAWTSTAATTGWTSITIAVPQPAAAAAPGPAAAMFKPPLRRRASRYLTFR